MIERIERRTFLAATLDGLGSLTVNGSTGDDTILLVISSANLVVNIQPEGFIQPFVTADVNIIGVVGDDGNDSITLVEAVTKPSVIQGEDGNDTITGGGGADVIQGGTGNDSIDGGLGADNLAGDTGIDTLTYQSRGTPLSLFTDGLANDGAAGEGDNIDTTIDILIGGFGDDRINVQTQTFTEALYGLGGDDTLVGGTGADRLNGGLGDDDLRGFDGDDVLVGGRGNDIMNGGGGNDTATYYYERTRVVVTIDAFTRHGAPRFAERDNLKLDVENVVGTNSDDRITGSPLSNTIFGLGGSDTLTGAAGQDSMLGGGGDDSFFAADGEIDTIDGGPGTDASDDDATDLVTNVP